MDALNAPQRKDLHEDFPLRNFVTCHTCEEPMTAAWSKGRSKRYGVFLLQNEGLLRASQVYTPRKLLKRLLMRSCAQYSLLQACFRLREQCLPNFGTSALR